MFFLSYKHINKNNPKIQTFTPISDYQADKRQITSSWIFQTVSMDKLLWRYHRTGKQMPTVLLEATKPTNRCRSRRISLRKYKIYLDFQSYPNTEMSQVVKSLLHGWNVSSMQHAQHHGPLARYVKWRVAHAPGMPGTFSSPPWVSDPDTYHGMCVTHVLWCKPGSLTTSFLWSQGRGKRSWHSRSMRNQQFYVSGKRPMVADKLVKQGARKLVAMVLK